MENEGGVLFIAVERTLSHFAVFYNLSINKKIETPKQHLKLREKHTELKSRLSLAEGGNNGGSSSGGNI